MVRCPNCKKGLTEADIEKGICPYCGYSREETTKSTQPEEEKRKEEKQIKIASLGKRFLAFIIDMIIISIIAGIISAFVPELTDEEMGGLAVFLGLCIYFPFFTSIWQATPGKMAMKIKVVDTNLKKASFLIIVLRETFGKLLASFCFGHLWLFFNKDRKEMWDYLARTLVVEK